MCSYVLDGIGEWLSGLRGQTQNWKVLHSNFTESLGGPRDPTSLQEP